MRISQIKSGGKSRKMQQKSSLHFDVPFTWDFHFSLHLVLSRPPMREFRGLTFYDAISRDSCKANVKRR